MKSLNELETVRYTLTSLANQNKDLDNRVKNHSSAVKKQMVFALLKGEIQSLSEITEYDSNIVELTDEAQTQVIIIETAEHVHSMNNHTVQEMEQSYPGPHPILGIEHFETGRYVFLLLIQETFTDDTPACIDQFQERLHELSGGTVTLGSVPEPWFQKVPVPILKRRQPWIIDSFRVLTGLFGITIFR
ncbi:hypothetical protein [Paenibacillus sp. DCT19]|uniref:hypothetical protein n=1 Tax=Paenibacillus sp. DCT19 TaxID=2211212 RepID=UPI000FE21502|nr:hypothetical protein [Paenibacillus sp. DCT19]